MSVESGTPAAAPRDAEAGSLRAGGERARRRVKWEGDGYLPWACRYFPRLCLRALGLGKRAGARGRRTGVAVLVVGSLIVFGLVAEKHRRGVLLASRVDDAGACPPRAGRAGRGSVCVGVRARGTRRARCAHSAGCAEIRPHLPTSLCPPPTHSLSADRGRVFSLHWQRLIPVSNVGVTPPE